MINDPYNYIGLIEEFLNKSITAKEFETRFFDTIREEKEPYVEGDAFAGLIDELFYYVEDYVDDEVLAYEEGALSEREEGDLDESQLRKEVTRIYKDIQRLK